MQSAVRELVDAQAPGFAGVALTERDDLSVRASVVVDGAGEHDSPAAVGPWDPGFSLDAPAEVGRVSHL
jgi:hypothetical protein